MTDKTDPRMAVLDQALYWAETAQSVDEVDVLAEMDAADRAAGIVRVDTRDEALVERIATAEQEARASYWDATTPAERAATGVDGVSRHVARAVLAALREAT